MKPWILTTIFLLSACAQAPGEPPPQPVRANPDGVAIDGYSPVAYFTEGKALAGDAAFSANHQGVTYWLRSAAEKQTFEANAQRYVPSHGGWCSLMMGGSGRRTPGDPENFAIVDDALLLFWSGDTPETRGMGLTNWASKTNNDPAQQSAYAEKADRQWRQFVAGERHSPIFLFKKADADNVTLDQRLNAKENYIE